MCVQSIEQNRKREEKYERISRGKLCDERIKRKRNRNMEVEGDKVRGGEEGIR